jgi:hypothetical protein
VLGSGRRLFLLGRSEKTLKNVRQLFIVIAESDRGNLLVYYCTPFCIMSLHEQLHIYNSYDYDCDLFLLHHEQLLIFESEVTELEKYQYFISRICPVFFCFKDNTFLHVEGHLLNSVCWNCCHLRGQ